MSWINPLEAGDTHTSTNSHTHTCTHGEAKHTHNYKHTLTYKKPTNSHNQRWNTQPSDTGSDVQTHTLTYKNTQAKTSMCADTQKHMHTQTPKTHEPYRVDPFASSTLICAQWCWTHSNTNTHSNTHTLAYKHTHTHTRTNTPSHSKHTKIPSKSNGSIRPKLETHPCSRKPKVGADHHCDPLNNVREIKLL